jgi:nicotinate-nucleotide adenylyltransferase
MPADYLKRPPAEPGMRIGLFGGSFNPPHDGHRLVALQCLRRLALDRVWILVSPGNPLKDHAELAPLATRVAAAERLMDHPQLDVTAFEAEHSFRYTYETLDYLVTAEPGVNFVWIMGADSLLSFDRWERWEEIARTMPMAVYARPGATFRATRSKAAVALAEFRLPEDKAGILAESRPPAWVYLRGIMSAQSSTAIRKARASSA